MLGIDWISTYWINGEYLKSICYAQSDGIRDDEDWNQ